MREPSPAVVRVDADFTGYICKVSLRQGRISDRKSSFINRNLFDLASGMASPRENWGFSPTDVAESAFLGAGWFGYDSQNLNCLFLPLLI